MADHLPEHLPGHLPVEMWHSIFNHLKLIDLPSCALVSKTFHSTVKAYRVREVAFTCRVHEWFHPDYSNYQHRVDYLMVSLLDESSFNLEFLRRLKIGRLSPIDGLNDINKFTYLEELDIDLKNYDSQWSRTLSLPNLKVLRLFMSQQLPYLGLNTPKLTKVCTASLDKLVFVYPQSVRCISTLFHCGMLPKFRNLEYLTFTNRYDLLDFNRVNRKYSTELNLTSLTKLIEVQFIFSLKFMNENWRKIKNAIETTLALKRPELKVLWMNMQATNSVLASYERVMGTLGSFVAFQLEHYEKLTDKVDMFWSFDFNRSMEMLPPAGFDPNNEFTSRFLARYSFRKIKVTYRTKYPKLLRQLIGRSSNLESLDFSDSGLGQSFFDRLAQTIQQNDIPLRHLRFHSTKSLNYDFVSKLRHLERFETYQRFSLELISKLLRLPSPQLTEINFCIVPCKIQRLSTKRFVVNGKPLSFHDPLNRPGNEPGHQQIPIGIKFTIWDVLYS